MLVFPGASLMEITRIDGGVKVRCPGCGREAEYRGVGHRDFTHDDGCLVYAQIEQATRIAERREVQRG